ncbi:MAG TPA: DsbC family protein, partial [Nitrosomonas europaea]|nr:DsbC family protein [Nitrosomonas europaea]
MWEPDLPRAKSAFEKETRVPLRAGHYIEPTLFKGFYAVRTGQAGGPSAYFREDMGWLGNIKSPGWVIQSPAEDNPAYKHTWLRQQLAQIPLEQLVLVKRSTPPVAVIWSAPD